MKIYHVRKNSDIIPLGRQGENNTRQIVFQVPFDDTGGKYVLQCQRAGDSEPYPVDITVSDKEISWTVTSYDVAKVGYGKCELQYLAGGVVAKSKIWKTQTLCSLGGDGVDEDSTANWFLQIFTKLAELESNLLPDASNLRDGVVLVTQNHKWALLHMGLDDITEEEF